MGAPAQTQQPVYYDTEKSQYYTIAQPSNNPTNNVLNAMMGITGLNKDINRNYLGNPYGTSYADRFTPKFVPAQYPEMNMLFPALNTGLLQGISSSVQPNGAMYGAGRFLAPQTTSESKGK